MASKGEYSACKHLLVAAFDFGTTYSGYAFSFKNDPMKIQTNQGWNAETQQLISLKTPTCVLLKPNKTFACFGYEAENKYSDLAEDNRHKGWMLFRRFKMLLHNNEGLSRSSTVKDINGYRMPAMQIFSMAIGYLRDHLLKALNTQIMGVNETDIQYVLTVPAIWNDHAKQFMREAAVEAGLDSKRLKLALEPEAASIWCQTVTTELKGSLSDIGCQYMVVDLGGGTADMSVHEKNADGSLKEIHRASGGPWGGTAVDKKYFDWLTRLFGRETMRRFQKEQMADYFDIQREFEIKKRSIKTNSDGKITFRVSASLKEIYKDLKGSDLKERVAQMGLSDKVTFTGDKLRVDASIVRDWFRKPISSIVHHMQCILSQRRMSRLKKILLVGGFGECVIVQDKIKAKIKGKDIIVPNEAGLSVLKGAVRFGHLPQIVTSRVMKYTYGVAVCRVDECSFQSKADARGSKFGRRYQDDSFDDMFDSELFYRQRSNKFSFDEEFNFDTLSFAGDTSDDSDSDSALSRGNIEKETVFDKFVTIGDEVPIGLEVKRLYTPQVPQRVNITVYSTLHRNPELVTDPGCEQLGALAIQFPDGKTCEDNICQVTLVFGDTEILVKAKVLRTGKRFYTKINCLK